MDPRDQKLHELLAGHSDKFPQQLAARFPHVIERLVALWGTAQIDRYFNELLVADDRRRQGFPPQVAREIFALSVLHDTLFPKGVERKGAWVEAIEFERVGRPDRGQPPGSSER